MDFRVRLGLGDALDAGLDPLDATSFCAFDLAFFAAGELFGKLQNDVICYFGKEKFMLFFKKKKNKKNYDAKLIF